MVIDLLEDDPPLPSAHPAQEEGADYRPVAWLAGGIAVALVLAHWLTA